MTENVLLVLLLVLCLGSVAVNFLLWRRHTDERFFYFPTAGVLRAVNRAWLTAQVVSMLLNFVGFLPSIAFLAICTSWNIAMSLYSIWYRQTQRRQMK